MEPAPTEVEERAPKAHQMNALVAELAPIKVEEHVHIGSGARSGRGSGANPENIQTETLRKRKRPPNAPTGAGAKQEGQQPPQNRGSGSPQWWRKGRSPRKGGDAASWMKGQHKSIVHGSRNGIAAHSVWHVK